MAEQMSNNEGRGGNTPLFVGLRSVSYGCAALGGIAIFAASLLVTYSVVARNLGLGGVRGDFELVELVCATCASLFLPLCQYNRGHVMVDLFTLWLPFRTQQRLDGLWMLVFSLGWGLLCWRLSHGLAEIYDYGDRTMLLRAPVWWVYVPAVLGTGLSAIIAFFQALPMLSKSLRWLEVRT